MLGSSFLSLLLVCVCVWGDIACAILVRDCAIACVIVRFLVRACITNATADRSILLSRFLVFVLVVGVAVTQTHATKDRCMVIWLIWDALIHLTLVNCKAKPNYNIPSTKQSADNQPHGIFYNVLGRSLFVL